MGFLYYLRFPVKLVPARQTIGLTVIEGLGAIFFVAGFIVYYQKCPTGKKTITEIGKINYDPISTENHVK